MATETNTPAAPVTTGMVLDFASTLINTPAKAARRELARERAWDKGLEACEVCGRALVGEGAEVFHDADTGDALPLGPTCSKRFARWRQG